ncbi:NAD(P)-binding protein [Serendipita vermifera]|nr:NAD(P)-binding protein [Serendipita vermifera]
MHRLAPQSIPKSCRYKRWYATDIREALGPRRAIVYKQTGDPSQVLYSTTNNQATGLGENQVVIKFLLSSINPADVNVIEGTYPSKPSLTKSFDQGQTDVFIGGNEGLAQVVQVSSSLKANGNPQRGKFDEGDWVVMNKPQLGTWTNWKVVDAGDILRIPKRKDSKVTEVFGATLMVNPPTAFGLLRDVDTVSPDSYVLQNGANSAVGQAVIQVAKQLKIKTVNFVRDRPDIEELKKHLYSIGATHVFTYDELLDKSFRKKFAELKGGDFSARHALNCIGGPTTTAMAALLDINGHLISYGGMSREPIKIPVGLQIFRQLTCHGYWHSSFWEGLPRDEQEKRMAQITQWKEDGAFEDPLHEIIKLKGSDQEVNDIIQDAIVRQQKGLRGKKLLLKWETQ